MLSVLPVRKNITMQEKRKGELVLETQAFTYVCMCAFVISMQKHANLGQIASEKQADGDEAVSQVSKFGVK